MADLTINGIDASTLGVILSSEEGRLGPAVQIPGELEIPGMRGAIFAGPSRVPVREFTLKAYLDAANSATVRTNLKKLAALLGDGQVLIQIGDWAVEIYAQCVRTTALPVAPWDVNKVVNIEMTFRASNPYWQDTSDTVGGFTSTPTGMPQGTAPSEPVYECVGAATTPQLKGYDYLSNELWSATFASLSSGEKYRINTAPGVMTIEKFTGGVWVSSESSLTAGVFPKTLPSNGVAYQSSLWPLLSGSTGTWTATYRKKWR